jgi:HECT-domain (ubiquitin-transferase)
MLVSGNPSINLSEWEENTMYQHGGYHKSESVVKWFWALVEDLREEERGLLLR